MARILIVSKCPTHPTIEGNRRFIINQVELFKQMGHEIYYLYIEEKPLFPTNKNEENNILPMQNYWRRNLFHYKVKSITKLKFNIVSKIRSVIYHGYEYCDDEYPIGLTSYVKRLNEQYKFDCCLVNYYILSKLLTNINIPLKGLVTHDYFSFKNLLVGEKKTWMGTSANQEAKALQRCPHIFALNSEEGIFFSKLSPKSIIYNVFSIYKYYKCSVIGNSDILFLSGYNQFNINGLNWFLSEIFPIIIEHFPYTKLKIGGGICERIKYLQNNPNIEIVGYVDDAKSFYANADVIINPTYQGTGLKIKTFEGISYDKVVLAHPHSLIGIYDNEKAPIFSSDVPKEWVSFLGKIWNKKTGINEIINIKKKNELYLHEMSKYIVSQYQKFFSYLLM